MRTKTSERREWNKKRQPITKQLHKVKDVYVVETEVVSSYADKSGCCPLVVTQYYMATFDGEIYRELFTNVVLEKKTNISTFDTPYVVEAKPLKEYLKNPSMAIIETGLLFAFLATLNAETFAKAISKAEDELEETEEFEETE